MKRLRYLLLTIVTYVLIVFLFESLIGVFQPSNESTIVITTFDEDGGHDRVVSRLESGGKLYVAANHWPRAWYDRAIEQPEIEATIDGKKSAYRAVPISGAEYDRVDSDNPLPAVFRFLTGFPPRYFVRLDPR